ncbi:unnamed protein product [Prunus armeniaca]
MHCGVKLAQNCVWRSVKFTDLTVLAQKEPDNKPYIIGKMRKSNFQHFRVKFSSICVTRPKMTFEGLSDFSLSWAAYSWKDKTKSLKIHIFPDFPDWRNKPKMSPQADCNALACMS